MLKVVVPMASAILATEFVMAQTQDRDWETVVVQDYCVLH